MIWWSQVKESDSKPGEDGDSVARHNGPLEAFKTSVKLFISRDMAILSFTFFYIGKLVKL